MRKTQPGSNNENESENEDGEKAQRAKLNLQLD